MRPRGVSASEVLRIACAAIEAEKRADKLESHARTSTCAWKPRMRADDVRAWLRVRRHARRAIAKARIAAIELLAAYEAAIARWEWWDAATGGGKLLGYKLSALRADGWPSLWSTNPLADALRDRARIGLGI